MSDRLPSGGWLRLSQFIVLALLILLFVILHTSILRKVQSLFGLRHDTPQIVLVTESCDAPGARHVPPPAFRANAVPYAVLRSVCPDSDRVEVWFTVPRGGRAGLFQNERLLAVGDSAVGHLVRVSTRLRPGTNRLAVLAEGRAARLPYATTGDRPLYVLPSQQPQGDVVALPPRRTWPTDQIWMVRPGPVGERRLLGRVQIGNGTSRDIFAAGDCGLHGDVLRAARCRSTEREGWAEPGYAIAPIQGDGTDSIGMDLGRTLAIARLNAEGDGRGERLAITFSACLAPDLPLAAVAEMDPATVTAQEAAARIFGLSWGATAPFDIVGHHGTAPLTVAATLELGCRRVSGAFEIPMGSIDLSGANFLRMDGDRLTIGGIGPDLAIDGPIPDPWTDPAVRTWRGRYDGEGGLRILDWGRPLPGAQPPTPAPVPPAPVEGAPDTPTVPDTAPVAEDDSAADRTRTLATLVLAAGQRLPAPLRALTEALAAGLPVLLLTLVAARRISGPARVAVPPLAALSFFVVSMAAQPLMLSMGQALLSLFPGLRGTDGAALPVSTNEYMPLGVLAATLMIPLARHRVFQGPHPAPDMVLTVRNIGYALGFIAMAILMMTFLARPEAVTGNFTGGRTMAWILVLSLIAWMSLSMIYAAHLLLAFLAGSVARPEAQRIALLGAVAIVAFPAVPALTGALDLIAELSARTAHPVFSRQENPDAMRMVPALRMVAAILPGLAYVAVLTLLLHSYAEVVRSSHAQLFSQRIPRGRLILAAAGLAALMALPDYFPLASGAADFSAAAYRVLGQFHDLANVVALTGPVVIWHLSLRHDHRAPFDPRPQAEAVLAASVAGYVTVVAGAIALAPALLVAGSAYFGLRLLALRPEDEAPPRRAGAATQTTGAPPDGIRLVRALQSAQLLDQRLAHDAAAYSEGKTDWPTLQDRRAEVAQTRAALDAELGASAARSKFLLLNNGPGRTPMDNAVIGLLLGLAYAIVFDVTRTIDFATLGPDGERWWSFLLRGTNLPRADVLSDVALLSQLQTLLRSLLFWPLLGFAFGALFHRLRGDDGFSKGAVMTGVLIVPLALAGVWTGGAQGLGAQAAQDILGRVLVTGLFLVGIGVLAFDMVTIHRSGARPGAIRIIYGVPTLVSYATILALATLLQSGRALLDMFSG